MNQFAEKAPRYDYVSIAATSILGGDSVKALGPAGGKEAGVVKDHSRAILPLPQPPTLASQKEPKQGLELEVNKGKAESAEAFSLSKLVVFPVLSM